MVLNRKKVIFIIATVIILSSMIIVVAYPYISDKAPPTIFIISPTGNSEIKSSSLQVVWTGSDEGSGIERYEVRLDEDSWINAGTSNNYYFDNVGYGNRVIYVKAIDKAGNSKEASVNFITTFLTTHIPIRIMSNSDFTPSKGVRGGSGTIDNPYMIEGWDIIASSHGIYISDTTAYFIIKNNYVHDGEPYYHGIELENVINGKIENNTSVNNSAGIIIYDSSDNFISENEILDSHWGIFLDNSKNITISNNSLSNNKYNLFIHGSKWFVQDKIENYLHKIDDSNTINGKPVYYYTNQKNLHLNGTDVGYLGLVNCSGIIENISISNNGQGILIAYSSYVTVKDSTFSYNTYGIHMLSSDNNTILNDSVLDNDPLYGIFLLGSSDNTISGNYISRNAYGLSLEDSSNNNVIYDNSIVGNGLNANIKLSSNNVLYHNNFILFLNIPNAYDDNPDNNHWHNPVLLEGNYWSYYNGLDDGSGTGKHAIAGDGIGDTLIPYPSPDYDFYPFIIEDGWK